VDRARKAFPDLADPFPMTLHLHPIPSFRHALPPLLASHLELLCGSLWITMDLEANRVTTTEVARMLRESTALVSSDGAVRVVCTLGQPGRKAVRDLHATAEVARRKGQFWVGFRAGSPPGLDPAAFPTWEDRWKVEGPHQSRLYETAIRAGRLPLRREFVNDHKGHTFVHTAGGEWTSHGWLIHFGDYDIACSVPGADEDDMSQRLDAILTACGSPAPRAYKLYVVSGPSPQPAETLARLYVGARTADWFASRYELGTAVQVTSAAELGGARPLLPNRGVMVVLWLIRLPATSRAEETYAFVRLLCKPDGHHLRVQVPAESSGRLRALGKALGVKLTV